MIKTILLLTTLTGLFTSCSTPEVKKKVEKHSPKIINGEEFFDGSQRRLATGLEYQIIKPGSSQRPTKYNNVVVHYKGMFENGIVFDSSYNRGEKAEFPLMRVIEGWREGIQFVGVGGKIHLKVPPKLGYGDKRVGSIPGGSTLYFVVELFEVK